MIYYIGIGTNLGDKQENISRALKLIQERTGKILRRSKDFISEPWGFSSENTFLNIAIALDSELSPIDLLHQTQAIEREMEGRELGKILNSFLAALNPETRRIFLRRYWYVDTIAEIASRYGLTESKVKMQLSRTRAKLQTYLEKEGITL